jgi:carboxymethylenebutenolidase
MRYDAVLAESVGIRGHGGDLIEAYTARPMDPGPHAGMIVIHHMPGYDAATKEITRRFATMGYSAICPNLYTREAPDADPDDAAATARANGGVPDERFVGDAGGAAAWLRALPNATGAVGAIGFCSGGRQAVLTGIAVDVQAAVDCYGAFVVGTPPEGFPLQVSPLTDRIGELGAPLLGLFGNDDSYPSPDQVDELEKLLQQHDKTYEFHRYDGAGHAFFSVDRPSYRPEAAVDGWKRIESFLATHLVENPVGAP